MLRCNVLQVFYMKAAQLQWPMHSQGSRNCVVFWACYCPSRRATIILHCTLGNPSPRDYQFRVGTLAAGSSALNDHPSGEAVVIKKYANRRLYNTASSTYVTLEDLANMVKQGTEFTVYDAKTGEDITRSVLTQIIFEEENKGHNLLPIKFLRQLIQFYGDQMQALVPSYLEMSLEQLTREQQRFRDQLLNSLGVSPEPFKLMDEQVKKNMTMFEDAMKLFNPFAAQKTQRAEPASAAREPASSTSELKDIQEQLREMQRRLESLTTKNS
jgi:polyhydroxyalkanoate synthesis repressor PhaR